MSALAVRLAERLADRLNPILVKEVRQALRSRYFKVMFWLTLSAATVIGLLVVGAYASRNDMRFAGQSFFMVIFGCLSAAVHAFTPFSAFLSTSGEWDENTHDLLVLSNLRPRQIVLGKLFSSLVQALLYYSTFGPFLVFAFLLNGIDLLTIGVLLLGSVASCVGLSLIGIALASLTRVKAVRGLLAALFAAVLVMAWGGSIGVAGGLVSSPQDLRSPEGLTVLAGFLTVALVLGTLFGALATLRFAHEEENRSTAMRVASLVLVLLAGVWGALFQSLFGLKVHATQIVAVMLSYLLWLYFLTEPSTLGRRTSKYVSPRRWRALLSAPFLPGGGLAVLLLLVQTFCALLGTRLALSFGLATSAEIREALVEVLVLYGYLFVFLGLPAGIGMHFVKTGAGRTRLRVTCLVSTFVVICLPALLGLLVGNPKWMEFKHPFNPAWTLVELIDRSPGEPQVIGALVLLACGVLLTVTANFPRALAGVREVLAASRARRERLARIS